MSFANLQDDGDLRYDDLLSESPVVGVTMLDDSNVEIDNQSRSIRIPESYADSGLEKAVNSPFSAVKQGAENSVRKLYQQANSFEAHSSIHPYRLGRNKSEDDLEEEQPDVEEMGFDIWDAEDDHRKSAYASVCGAVGTGSSVIGGNEAYALGFGAATAGLLAFNSYSRGRRDELVENAAEGLSEAYGDYEVDFKEENQRSDKLKQAGQTARDKAEWVTETLRSL